VTAARAGAAVALVRGKPLVERLRPEEDDYFVLKNLCARIDELVAAKGA